MNIIKDVSVNNKLILEPYRGGKKLEMEVKSGFGTVRARSTLIGLKLLKDAQVYSGGDTFKVKANSVVFFNEEVLISQEGYRKPITFDGKDIGFVVGNYNDAIYIKENDSQ